MKQGILAVSLNPAVDETVFCPGFRPGVLNRAACSEVHAGGKALNVARYLSGLSDCGQITLTGFLGAENDSLFCNAMAGAGIADYCLRIPGSTRRCIKIIDGEPGSGANTPESSSVTELNYPGLSPTESELNQLLDCIEKLADGCAICVLSGSLPPGVPDDLYAQIIRRLKPRGCMTVLDSSGAALREGLRAGPDALKPNLEEFSELVREEVRTVADCIRLIGACADGTYESCLLAVSMGADGAVFSLNGQCIQVIPPPVNFASSVGAGDAMTAGIAAGLLAGENLREIAVQSCALGACAVEQIAPGLHDPGRLEEIRRTVQILEIGENI